MTNPIETGSVLVQRTTAKQIELKWLENKLSLLSGRRRGRKAPRARFSTPFLETFRAPRVKTRLILAARSKRLSLPAAGAAARRVTRPGSVARHGAEDQSCSLSNTSEWAPVAKFAAPSLPKPMVTFKASPVSIDYPITLIVSHFSTYSGFSETKL